MSHVCEILGNSFNFTEHRFLWKYIREIVTFESPWRIAGEWWRQQHSEMLIINKIKYVVFLYIYNTINLETLPYRDMFEILYPDYQFLVPTGYQNAFLHIPPTTVLSLFILFPQTHIYFYCVCLLFFLIIYILLIILLLLFYYYSLLIIYILLINEPIELLPFFPDLIYGSLSNLTYVLKKTHFFLLVAVGVFFWGANMAVLRAYSWILCLGVWQQLSECKEIALFFVLLFPPKIFIFKYKRIISLSAYSIASLPNHLPSRHLGCFQVLVIINNPYIIIMMQIFLWIRVLILFGLKKLLFVCLFLFLGYTE